MSQFHTLLHGEMWEAGPDQGSALQALLDKLGAEPLPEGVARLSSARMTLGPHLAPQMEQGRGRTVAWLDTRRRAS